MVVVGFPLLSCVVVVVARYRNCAMFMVVVPMVMVVGSVLLIYVIYWLRWKEQRKILF